MLRRAAAFLHPRLISSSSSSSRAWSHSPRLVAVRSVSTAAQVRSDRSRCEGAVMMMGDMEFSTQALKPGLAKLFWASCRREAYASLYHPFVVSLAAGTLPKRGFQRYMAQDAYFLEAFQNAYQMAMESTEDEEAKATIDSLKRDVQEELALHSSVMQSMDGDQTYFEPNTATTVYCEFLRASGISNQTASTSAKIIAAMTPCMRLYAFLGQEIKKNINQVPDHPYQQWIDTYSSADFEAVASKVEQLLDKLTETLTKDEEKALLYKLYKRAMTLEVDFFSAQQPGPVAHIPFLKPENRLLLVSDFDSTCTISDSCPVLADLTVQVAGKVPGVRAAGETAASVVRNKWDELVMRYMDEYEKVLTRSLSNKGRGKAFTKEELQEFLKEMSDFELKANARVEEAAVLKGLSPAAIQDAGKSMPLREGCAEFFKRLGAAHEGHVDAHILSVCWSKLFIEAVLEQGEIHVANITANELVFDGATSTGKIAFQVQTALDKHKHFLQILTHLNPVHSIYIGDSLTDLLCLLRADVGIVLGDSSTLKEVYGEKAAPLFRKAVEREGGGRELCGFVFSVASWFEVEAFLFGPPPVRSQSFVGGG